LRERFRPNWHTISSRAHNNDVHPETQSWVEGANEPHGFGLAHLPYGAFHHYGDTRLCVRIGDQALNLADCVADELLDYLSPELRQACLQSTLNALLALGPESWQALRSRLSELLDEQAPSELREQIEECLYPLAEVELVLPLTVGNYTDFYASLHHARRVGEIFRPDNPLLPNYKHVPIGYHGRASSIVVSGTDIRRPWGQSRPVTEGAAPTFAPSAALDYEVELALIVGTGNRLGQPIPIAEASEHLFGVALLNDWSARDIQSWEYQPLGPFLGKSFATTLSPWITPLAALEPFRVAAQPRPPGDPQPLPYLFNEADQATGALDIKVTASIITAASRTQLTPLSTTNTRELYWTPAQMVAHHTSNGCNLQPGDILATGTLSGPERDSAGCLLELTQNGAHPLQLPNGEQRAWLADGDEVKLTASCERSGHPKIQLGSCTGRIVPALA
jgi:fumarylacetoacetase